MPSQLPGMDRCQDAIARTPYICQRIIGCRFLAVVGVTWYQRINRSKWSCMPVRSYSGRHSISTYQRVERYQWVCQMIQLPVNVQTFWVQSNNFVHKFWVQSKRFLFWVLFKHFGAKQDFCSNILGAKQHICSNILGAKLDFSSKTFVQTWKARLLFKNLGCDARLLCNHHRCKTRLLFKCLW